ncbi:RNA polymerase sigma factor [Candidatus Nomurabacteria bacterium]|nr:RNA polymerase sigma factor [Candidatus Nomurabacteria bacterium]
MDQKTKNLSDELIVQLIQKGQQEPFSFLVERYEKKLKSYAYRFLNNQQDIEDLVQETFIKAFVNIQSFDLERKFSSWLYRIAHNTFVNHLKKKKNDLVLFFDADTLFPHPIAKERPDKDAELKELQQMLDYGLDQLDAKYKEPVILYYLQDLSYQDISDVMQIPVSTVGVRIKRAKENLAKIFKEKKYE